MFQGEKRKCFYKHFVAGGCTRTQRGLRGQRPSQVCVRVDLLTVAGAARVKNRWFCARTTHRFPRQHQKKRTKPVTPVWNKAVEATTSRRLVHPRVRCRCRRYRMEIDVLHHILECVVWRMRLCQRRRRRRLVCMFSSAEWTHSGPAVRTVDNYYAICGMHRYRACARSNSRVCCCLGYVFLCKCSELSISALQRRCTDDNNPLMWCYG